jgi:hypothetical protein
VSWILYITAKKSENTSKTKGGDFLGISFLFLRVGEKDYSTHLSINLYDLGLSKTGDEIQCRQVK